MSGKAAPTFQVIPDGRFYPLEPIQQGDSASVTGLVDLAENVNSVISTVTPFVICDAPLAVHDASDSPGPATYFYRIPEHPEHAATPTLQVRVWGLVDAVGSSGTVTVTTSVDSAVVALTWTGGANTQAEFSGSLEFDPSVDEAVKFEVAADVGIVKVFSWSVWVDVGDNPQPLGVDTEGYSEDQPLSVHRERALVSRLDSVLASRPGVILSYAGETNQGDTRGWHSTTSTTWTRIAQGIPVRLRPGCTALTIYGSGYDTGTAGQLRVTMPGSVTVFSTLVLPATGSWTPNAWVSGTLTLAEAPKRMTETVIHIDLLADTQTYIAGLCIWEAT